MTKKELLEENEELREGLKEIAEHIRNLLGDEEPNTDESEDDDAEGDEE